MQRGLFICVAVAFISEGSASFQSVSAPIRPHGSGDAKKVTEPRHQLTVTPASHDLVVQPVQPKTAENFTNASAVHTKPVSFAQGSTKNLKTWIKSSNMVWKISCDKHLKMHPSEITCPGNCPFLRAEPTRLCQFKCVPAKDCNSDNPLASFANPESKVCEACKVPGCHHCGKTRHDCATCQDGFFLKGGSCLSSTRAFWHAIFVIAFFLVAFVLYYVFALLFLRETKNAGALKAGLQFRELSSTRNVAKDKPYSLTNNLMTRMINGAGVMLHFRWQGAIMVWAIFGTVLFAFAGLLFWERLGVVHRPNARKSYDACENNVANTVKEFNNMEVIYFVCVLILYFFTMFGSLWFAIAQKAFYAKQDHDNTTMKDFSVLCHGFPTGTSGSARIEEERLEFFRSQPQFKGLDIVGVSVCWDFREKQDAVYDQLRREFDIACSEDSAAYAQQTANAEQASQRESKRTCGIDPTLQSVDAVFGIGSFPCAGSGDVEKPESEDVKQLLEEITTSGNLFVIFGNTKDRAEAFARCRKDMLVYPHEGDTLEIQVEESECEPVTVVWKGYGTPPFKFLVSLILGCSFVFVCVLILDLCFYAPYVIYILSYSDVPGMSQGGVVSGLLLGLLITVCNQIIFMLIGAVADRCGWTNSDSKDCFYCVKYTLAVFFNTCLDLGTVLILAQGYSVDMAMQMQVADDSTMSPKAVAESPNMQKALYVQLVTYIFPSCTLLPFLLEPIGTAVVPFFLSKALVRSRPEVTVQDAEELLQNPPYDLSRYGDILVNMMLCCMTMVFTYYDLYKLFVFMIISLTVIYVWDQMRVLRYTTKTVFATSTMDDAVMYLMALPGAILAMALVFKAYGASHHGFLDDLRRNLEGEVGAIAPDRYNIFFYLVVAFIGHIILHACLLKFVVFPYAEKEAAEIGDMKDDFDKDLTYPQLCAEKPANFFNTNPVHCLRSRYVYAHDPPCFYYRIGKEHLMKKNEEIGIYFDGKVHVEDTKTNDEYAIEEDDNKRTQARKVLQKGRSGLMKFSDGD